ncbi:MAG: hypothetical protein HUU46_07805 [Candidatus Hydrogenedentes bacterium]|nr:hypothetical protein [Candidatus Hydrogenedentota bacterium]
MRKVDVFELPREVNANYFALCPVCAAKCHEFVFHRPDNARDKLRQLFEKIGDASELPVTLGKEAATIRFVEIDAFDLREAIKATT